MTLGTRSLTTIRNEVTPFFPAKRPPFLTHVMCPFITPPPLALCHMQMASPAKSSDHQCVRLWLDRNHLHPRLRCDVLHYLHHDWHGWVHRGGQLWQLGRRRGWVLDGCRLIGRDDGDGHIVRRAADVPLRKQPRRSPQLTLLPVERLPLALLCLLITHTTGLEYC